ncbi:MAG: DinB family protein [Acidimicrobiales bacterium]
MLAGGHCPACGFDFPTVSPSDVAVAARSYPRRYRALLLRPDEEDPGIVHRRPGPGLPSAAEHALEAAAGMAAAAEGLLRLRAQERPPVDLDPPVAGDGATLEAVLERLDAGAGALAAAVEALHGDEWGRRLVGGGGQEVNALDVARAGVHAGSHHLRAAERVIDQVRGRP